MSIFISPTRCYILLKVSLVSLELLIGDFKTRTGVDGWEENFFLTADFASFPRVDEACFNCFDAARL